jgi:hypothetical protein
LYTVLQKINAAFRDSVLDTISFASKTALSGVKRLLDVPYMHPTPGAEPQILPNILALETIPERFELEQNYPNPFNPATTIGFTLPSTAYVTLKIYNILGQEVATLINNEVTTEGQHELEFNANMFSSGVYFYRIVANPLSEEDESAGGMFTNVKKMLLVK